MNAITQIKSDIENLGATDVVDLENFVAKLIQKQILQVALAKRAQTIVQSACIYCGMNDLMRWGHSKAGTQRFKCRNCKATFGTTNQTPFFRLRNRHLWTKYLGTMRRHVPLKDLPAHHGIGLSLPTLHRWRHRFLACLTLNPTQRLAGLIEADEKFFRTSFKGSRGWKRGTPPQARKARARGEATSTGISSEQVPVATACDRSGAIFQAQLADTKWATIELTVAPWLEPQSILITDGHRAYKDVAYAADCEHLVVKAGVPNTQRLSTGRIDAYHRSVENLINRRCLGVGTRYLMNYFGWARRITQHKPFGNDLLSEFLGA